MKFIFSIALFTKETLGMSWMSTDRGLIKRMLEKSRGNKGNVRAASWISGASTCYIIVNIYSFTACVLCAKNLLSFVLFFTHLILTPTLGWIQLWPLLYSWGNGLWKMHALSQASGQSQQAMSPFPMPRGRWGEGNLMGDISRFSLC